MGYSPNNPLIPGDPYSYDLKWMVQQIKAWKDPLDSAERAEAAAESAAISAAEAQAAAGSLDQPFVTPEMFGAVGDGITDDKEAFRSAFAASKTVICHNNKTYAIGVDAGELAGITIPSGGILDLNGSAIQILNPTNITNYYGIYIKAITKACIRNGSIFGDRLVHSGSTGEHGHAVVVSESSDVILQDLYLANCWGDGIYVGGIAVESTNVIIENCHCYNNRRNGISIVKAQNVYVSGCVLEDTNGTLPEYGIDVETDTNADVMKNIIISGCSFINNAGGALNMLSKSDESSMIASNIIADGDVAVALLGDNSTAIVSNASLTPLANKNSLLAGCYGKSSVIFDDIQIDAVNGVTSALIFMYGQAHENIICNANVIRGTLSHLTLAYDNTTQHNCDVNITINPAVTITNINGEPVIANRSDITNRGDVYYYYETASSVINGWAELAGIKSANPNTNINLWNCCTQNVIHRIINQDSNSHSIIAQTFVNIITGSSSSSVALAPGATMCYWYNAINGTVSYYVI